MKDKQYRVKGEKEWHGSLGEALEASERHDNLEKIIGKRGKL